MARPLRIEFAGALYHVMSRGDRQESIFPGDEDRKDWLVVLSRTCDRFNWLVHAYCQMTNHYHLLIETVDGNLSRGMRQLNGVYTQHFNQRHKQVGHLFQGRYQAILVQRDTYLLELSRYVVLNPLRARMVNRLEHWQWSSYPSVMGYSMAPDWLDADWLLSQFGKHRKGARKKYAEFVMQGAGLPSPLDSSRGQLLLGDEAFIDRFKNTRESEYLREHSKSQRRALAPTLAEYRDRANSRDLAMAEAYLSGAYTMQEIADFFGVHYMTVSRAVRKWESK